MDGRLVLALGVSLFLLIVAPTRGDEVASTHSWLIAAPPIVGFVLLCIAAARRGSRPVRPRCGSASGPAPLFGTSAVLTKAFVHFLGGGVLNWVPHWEPYTLAVSSITGLVLSQSAFQTGGLAAAVGAEQVMQPLTGVALGVGLLDEHLGISGSTATIALIGALLAMLWGLLTLGPDRASHDGLTQPPAGSPIRNSLQPAAWEAWDRP